MARSRRKVTPTVQITVTQTIAVRCETCQSPATGRLDLEGRRSLTLCDACFRAWQALAAGQEGHLVELRG